MITIGVDPGVHTGLAIANNGELIVVAETNFWGAVATFDDNPDAIVIIELPATKHVWHNQAKTKGSIQKTGVNVGSVIREAELLKAYLDLKGRKVITQKPQGKRDAEEFKRLTGWTKRTNQHMRDAACLVYSFKVKERSENE